MIAQRLCRLVAATAVAAVGLASLALAASKHGITPVAPKAGATVPAGKSPTFKMRVKGKGSVYVYVCKSAKKDSKGLICADPGIVKAHRSGKYYVVKPKFFDYAEFWLNTPGTYYWQAHRISCERGNLKDCYQEGPVVKFKVG